MLGRRATRSGGRPEAFSCTTMAHAPARTPRRSARLVAVVVLALLGLGVLLGGPAGAQSLDGDSRVLLTTVKGPITPVVAGHIRSGIARAERDGYVAYMIRLDTPGGLDTSMRDIVQHLFAAEVPVIVHIAPSGARGASAGAIITFASHVAAMAPGTTIGAATPVAGGTGEDLDAKILNDAIAYAESIADARDRDPGFIVDTVREGRSASASEALRLGAIDIVVTSTAEVLDAADGRVVRVGPLGREVELRTAGAVVVEHEMGLFRSIQQLLADPNIAFLLLSIGTLGLIYELASPGMGVGAVLGLAFITLGLFGLAVLPVNVVGIVFLLLAAALFVAEVFAPGIGLAAAGGAFALVMSGIFLVDDAPGLQVSLVVVLPVAVVVAGFVVIAGRVAMRVRTAPSTTTGSGLYVGHEVVVRVRDGRTQAFIAGAWWSIRPVTRGAPFADGDVARIVEVRGLDLVAEPALPNDDPERDLTTSLSPSGDGADTRDKGRSS
jgi:membrane-bound serine protease (ClpP class)